jgi:hypothetical protein
MIAACSGATGEGGGRAVSAVSSTTSARTNLAAVAAALCGTDGEPTVFELPDAHGEGFVGRTEIGPMPNDCSAIEVVGRAPLRPEDEFFPEDANWLKIAGYPAADSAWVFDAPCASLAPDCADVIAALPIVDPERATVGRADLVLEFTPNPAPKTGDPCGSAGALVVPSYDIRIVNRGAAASARTLEYDSPTGFVLADVRIRGLEPGEWQGLGSYDENKVVRVDPKNVVPESDETNNEVRLPDRPEPALPCV